MNISEKVLLYQQIGVKRISISQDATSFHNLTSLEKALCIISGICHPGHLSTLLMRAQLLFALIAKFLNLLKTFVSGTVLNADTHYLI